MGRSRNSDRLSADPVASMVGRTRRQVVAKGEFELVIMGIDPGSRSMGWGVVGRKSNALHRIAGGVIRPPRGPLPGRLGWILNELTRLIDEHEPDGVAVESAFVHVNPRTALVLGQARGLPIALAAARRIAVAEYAPALVKRQVVGRGRATKVQVRRMIAAQLGLSELPSEDEADALSVAVTHFRLAATTPSGETRTKTPAQLQYEAALRNARSPRRRR